tara:strand:+ start:401 stop:733 length:333 start_codon:yes stop_codon:yes gene_type:complete
MQELIEKYFKKTNKNIWSTWNDFILKDYLNPEYGFYLTATLHCPIKTYLKSDRLEHRLYKIFLHRTYHIETFESNLEDNESELVYKGLIENKEDLKFLLYKTGIVNKPII